MAAGSQLEKGICALFVRAAVIIRIVVQLVILCVMERINQCP